MSNSNSFFISTNNEYRCPECFLVPFINISTNENKLYMSTKCINNHIYLKSFEEMKLLYKSSISSKISCANCENRNKQNFFNNLNYCSDCYKFFCTKHGEMHKLNEKHKIFFNKKFDSTCIEHNGTSFVGYCSNHNKNYCFRCEHFNENNHKFIEELSEAQIENFENGMKKNEGFLKEIEFSFNNYKRFFLELENNFLIFKENINKKIQFIKEIINFYKIKKSECDINYQMKANIENNFFDLNEIKQNITNNFSMQIKEIFNLITFLKKNDINYELDINKEIHIFKDFKIENINNVKTINYNKGQIYCIKTLIDGRLAAGDSESNLIIYNNATFNPDIIIQNNLGQLYNFIQLKNNNIVCSFYNDFTLKIIKINNNNYENIQIIKNAHKDFISKIIEVENENLITFSFDYSFKIWYLNNNNNLYYYEKINEFCNTNEISDGIEIKYNEIILYSLNSYPQSLVFYNLYKDKIIQTLNNLNLYISYVGERIVKLNNEEVAIAGNKKVYLIDINNYHILNEINTYNCNNCILMLLNNLLLIGDEIGNISQYKIVNKKIIKESTKNKSHKNKIYSMTILNDVIISGENKSHEIKIWKI